VSAKTREINAETVRLSKISFLNGSGTSFDLVLTERQLRVSDADLAVSEFSVLQAKIAALLALSDLQACPEAHDPGRPEPGAPPPQ
jgi:hypothetical protein